MVMENAGTSFVDVFKDRTSWPQKFTTHFVAYLAFQTVWTILSFSGTCQLVSDYGP